MAYTLEQWKEAKILYEAGGKTLREIESITGISNGQISKRAKKELWEKGSKKKQIKSDIIELDKKESEIRKQKEAVLKEVALNFDDIEITMLQDLIESETKCKSLVLSTSSLALIRTNQMLTKGTKQVPMKVKEYHEGRPVGESYEFIDTQLEPKDLKEITESIDKASITLGVNQRHANSQVAIQNNNQNNQLIEDEIIITRKGH